MCAKKRRFFSVDFKKKAVTLSEDPDKTVKKVAEDLGVSCQQLYKWRQIYLEIDSSQQDSSLCHPPKGGDKEAGSSSSSEARRILELENKLKEALNERDILKKAMILFSKDQAITD